MILSELTTGNLASRNAMKFTHIYIIAIGATSIIIALYVTSIIQTLLFALTIYSGAFVIPTLAGLLNLKVNKKRVVLAIVTGGLVALTGKIIYGFYNEMIGNIIIISTYGINAILLFTPVRKS
jgi:SSS family solute:Na+ symporter